jgi:4-hydroxybenzoate polyprenyltransferase
MFAIGQLFGAVVLGLIFGAIAQSYAKGKNQPDLGNMALATCTIVTVIAGFIGFSGVAGLVTMVGFIVAASNK